MLEKRNALATIRSFPSFAHMTFANNRVAKSSEQVIQFLIELSSKLKDKTEQEMNVLRSEKELQEGNREIYAWDRIYYITQAKAKRYCT